MRGEVARKPNILGKTEGCVAPGDAFARCRQQDGEDAHMFTGETRVCVYDLRKCTGLLCELKRFHLY